MSVERQRGAIVDIAAALRSSARRGFLALLASSLLAVGATAQSTDSGSLIIDHFGLEDGLPGLFIRNLAISEDGMMWLYASGILASFDGLEFESHDLTPFGSEDLNFRGLGSGRGDTVWVAIGRQLFSYSAGRPALRGELPTRIMGIWQAPDGTMRLWDDYGLVRLTENGYQREVTFVAPIDSTGPPDAGFWPPLQGDRWVALSDQGGNKLINRRRVADPLPFPEAWAMPDTTIRAVVARLTETGMVVTRLDGSPLTTIPGNAGQGELLLDRQGRVWQGSPGRITAFGPAGDTVATMQMAPDAAVTLTAEDAEGNIWVGTLTHGLYRIRPRTVSVLGAAAGLTDGQVRNVSAGDDGSVLVLHYDGDLTRVGPDGVDTVYEASPGNLPLVAVGDRRGAIWVAVSGDRPRLWGRLASGDEVEIPLVGFPSRMIEDPREDGALIGGTITIRPYATGDPISEPHRLPRGWRLRDVLVDPEGVVWMVGDGGLARLSDTTLEQVSSDEGYPLIGARSVHRTSDGSIWIGTYRNGIVRFRDGRFDVVRASDGLWDDGASTILEDGSGNLWMSANRGVHRVAVSDLNAFLDGEIGRVRGRGYGEDAGFQNPETSGGHGYRSPDGRLWFPTFSGVAVIDPEQVLAQEQATPGIRIRGVISGGEMIRSDSIVRLPRGQRRVDLVYGATFLSGQRGMRYEVLLDGVDADWADAGGQRQITYGNVPPGRQTIRVRAISGSGVASADEASITLVVPYFFHETAGFRLLLLVLAASGLWFAYHLRIRRLQAREVRLERLVHERTHELAESKNETETALATVEAQARELRSLDEAKSRFFANVSHELRTPLTLVQGPLQDVLDGRLGPTPEAVREQVATVLASGRRLGELVEQLLDVARLESGEFRLHRREQDLKPLFERLAQAFEALARSRGIVFNATLPFGAIVATVDTDQIEKVYGNLLSNAFKFTPGGGHVRFAVEIATPESQLVVTVEDDGPGIPVDEQAHIFERFHQVDDTSKRVHEGVGLGLALVKEVTELHGGSIELRSEPGRGSRFTVRLPMNEPAERSDSAAAAPAGMDLSVPPVASTVEAAQSPDVAAPAAGAAHAPDVDVETREAGTAAKDAVSVSPAASHGAEATSVEDAARLTVLVVEDHADLRAYLRRHLEDSYHVIEASNGREGLDAARGTVPDLILCDVMMPEMDGEEMCRAIRADPELAYLPVIMLTARASRESRLSALEGGADDYLVKPFDPEELRLRVRNALASRQRFAQRLLSEGKTVPFVPLALPESSRGHDFVMELDAVLRERMGDEDFDVDAMASAMAMSRATLYRKADEALGMSPMEWLWKFRLTQAAHWLRETDGTVSEIAYGSGFKTVPHFTRRFKEQFGTTPAVYRRRAG